MSDHQEIRVQLPRALYDSHFHALHMEERGFDIRELLSRLFKAGLAGGMEVAVDEHNFERRLELTGGFPDLFLSAGIHPSSTGSAELKWDDRFAEIHLQVANPRVRAIGETGLDFFRDYAPADSQERAFRDHLDLASETGLPVIIHNRNADERVLALIRESECRHGIFHCFSSDRNTAEQALELGFHISFAGNITYKKTEAIRDAAIHVPSDRILIETDSPYLSPQSVRGRSNHPGHMGYTLQLLAELRGESPDELAAHTVENTRRLFLPE